jgi:hypothetical protein
MTRIDQIRHPYYEYWFPNWEKFRLTYEGGKAFVESYLEKFSTRETDDDFLTRKNLSYCPAHAKAAIIDIRNSIFQRMVDITRTGGPDSYRKACLGLEGGVDLNGSTMDSFIGRIVLPELLVMGRVGIFVDKPEIPSPATLRDTKGKRPYLYYYQAEDILSWSYNSQNQLEAVLLRDYEYFVDETTGLVSGETDQYRLIKMTEDGVSIEFYGIRTNEQTHLPEQFAVKDPVLLPKLKQIPFVIFEISSSLLIDVADYQIALLNLASSDLNYALKSNFPFYVEQFNPQAEQSGLRPPNGQGGDATNAKTAADRRITVGVAQGRRYPIGADAPTFINPSPDPLRASMEKQDRLVAEIRQLVNTAVTNLKPTRASAESKEKDQQGLEAGLSYIGLELEHGERQIASIWNDYEGSKEIVTLKYPDNYSLRADDDRRREARELKELLPTIPSVTFQKAIAKQIARVTVASKIPVEDWEKINKEIDKAPVIVSDPEVVKSDHEAGFVSTETASKLRLYPDGEVEQAKKDHAERAKRILEAQMSVKAPEGMQSRGVDDLSSNSDEGKQEKAASRDNTLQSEVKDRTRGEGK